VENPGSQVWREVQSLSRNGRDHARRFGEVVRAIGFLPECTMILDGEVAIFDEQLVSRFRVAQAWGS
jgi:ATP-dependent DNA ligase